MASSEDVRELCSSTLVPEEVLTRQSVLQYCSSISTLLSIYVYLTIYII